MKTTYLNFAVLFLISVASANFISCSGADSKEQAKEKQESLPVVAVETVTERPVDQIGEYTATVEPDLINNISAAAPNRIKQILVDEGMRVGKGQRLVVMDDVNTVAYQTQVDNAKANLNNVQINYDRAVELFKIGGGTKQQVDQMETQLINARNTLAAAERTLRNAQENTVLTAPISGVVTARNYDPGDMSGSMPILTIARVQPVKIVINVTESELSHIKKGMPANVTFDTYGDEVFNGTVTMVAPTVDPASRTFGVEITSPNSDDRILPGMFGRATMNLGTKTRVVVPDKAVVKQQGSGDHYVYVYNSKDGTVSYNKVELGQRLGAEYELISGVEPGSQVVVSGQTRLANGKKVNIKNEKK
ncbi:MAG: efflux RND transporter periplasmic adaptor subunit [Muribaculaceae bacterium]|nr:efflux RND transporter periplasmic adaptor subunit [Muribaculaceae bacterium]